jgi:hypothetical protein
MNVGPLKHLEGTLHIPLSSGALVSTRLRTGRRVSSAQFLSSKKKPPKLAGDFHFSSIIGLMLIKRIDSGSQQFKAGSVKSGMRNLREPQCSLVGQSCVEADR